MAKERKPRTAGLPGAPVVRRPTKRTARVPIGIEKVLYLAASNGAFRERLLADRAAAIGALGVRLTDVERSTLLGVPRPALEAMIARISPRRHGRRRLMRTVAAATVSLAAGVAAPGCDDETEPDRDAEVDVPPDIAGDTAWDADVDIPPDVAGDTAWDTAVDAADIDLPPDAEGGIWPEADVDPDWAAADGGDDDAGPDAE